MLLGFAAAFGASIVYGVAAVTQALSARRSRHVRGFDPRLLVDMMRRPATAVTLILLGTGFVLHLISVRLLPLFLAQAGISVSLVVTALTAATILRDRLRSAEWAAVGGVVVGLVLLATASAATGQGRGPAGLVAVLIGVTAGIVAAGTVLLRIVGPWSTAGLSALSGAGYAVVGVSARIVPGTHWWHAPETLVLVVAGIVGFILYSVALQRGSVTTATAPMIVVQTVLPAVTGLAVLGDQVRAGGSVLVLVGLVMVLVAAVALIRAEDRMRLR